MTFLSLLLISAGMWTLGIGIGLSDPWLYWPGAVAIAAGCCLLWLVDRMRRPARLEEADWEWPVWSGDGGDGRTLRRAEAYRRHYFESDEKDEAA